MIITTTPNIEGKKIKKYLGVIAGEGNQDGFDEGEDARADALDDITRKAQKLGAEAIVGVNIDHQVIHGGGKIRVSISGTAVTIE